MYIIKKYLQCFYLKQDTLNGNTWNHHVLMGFRERDPMGSAESHSEGGGPCRTHLNADLLPIAHIGGWTR